LIVLDTSVLSLVLRRRRAAGEPREISIFRRVIASNVQTVVPGIVFQEVLSGVRDRPQFLRLKTALDDFPLLIASPDHHLAAAEISNTCVRHGVAAGVADCLIAALTIAERAQLFTTDRDFSHIAAHCGLEVLDLDAIG